MLRAIMSQNKLVSEMIVYGLDDRG